MNPQNKKSFGEKVILKCKYCLKDIKAYRWKRKQTQGWFFKDMNHHRLLTSNVCYMCGNRIIRKRKPMDEVTNPGLMKNRACEHRVREYYESIGCKVKMTTAYGPDLIVYDGEKIFTVEVKRAHWNKKKTSIIANRVTPNRMNDDFVAIVYEDKVYIETMKEYLKHCSKGGKRTLTAALGLGNRYSRCKSVKILNHVSNGSKICNLLE